MFKKPKPINFPLEEEIDHVLTTMSDVSPTDREYSTLVDHLVKLNALRPTKEGVSADVKVTTIAHLAGILLIVGHERAHVVTSKALTFIQKLR